MNYKSEKDHFVLCWQVVYQSLWFLIGSIPGFDKDELATTKETVLGHLDGVKANVEALQAEPTPPFSRITTTRRRSATGRAAWVTPEHRARQRRAHRLEPSPGRGRRVGVG